MDLQNYKAEMIEDDRVQSKNYLDIPKKLIITNITRYEEEKENLD